MMDLLTHDHEEIEYDWQLLAQMLGKPEGISDNNEFQTLAIAFEKKQREHLKREEEDFLPKIELILSLTQKQEAGKKMLALRNLELIN